MPNLFYHKDFEINKENLLNYVIIILKNLFTLILNILKSIIFRPF